VLSVERVGGNLNQFTKQINGAAKRGEFGVVVALRYLARLVTIESGLTNLLKEHRIA